MGCFGLAAYLESNCKMRAMNNRWTCPVCSTVLKPSDLRIDGYVERVLAETPAHVEEVAILEDLSYTIVEEEEARPPSGSPAPEGDAMDGDQPLTGGDDDEPERSKRIGDGGDSPNSKRQK